VYQRTGDESQARLAWDRFRGAKDAPDYTPRETEAVTTTLNPIAWWPNGGTNDIAQWGLAAIQILHMVGDFAPEE
jgi:hypothetical protein